jgi:UDP-GlcNAc:undecaprenyl-phosphate GlcNAc-1-phosphate transferase
MRLGFYHTEAVVIIYVLQALLVTWAFVFRFHSEWFFLGGYILFSSLVLGLFLAAERRGWRFEHHDVLDRMIKGKLRELREKGVVIRVSFTIVKSGIPVLILLSCLIPRALPRYSLVLSASLIAVVLGCWLFKKAWLGGGLRVALYLLIPMVIYLSRVDSAVWLNDRWMQLYDLSFGVLALFVVITLRFTRRKKGFKSTPMDFLILFIALVVPNLPDPQIQSYHMGLVAAKIVVALFGCEVLFGELRGELRTLRVFVLCALGATAVRGVVG